MYISMSNEKRKCTKVERGKYLRSVATSLNIFIPKKNQINIKLMTTKLRGNNF